jgi:hypothetical protein
LSLIAEVDDFPSIEHFCDKGGFGSNPVRSDQEILPCV